ncbi:hypothetical protein KFK09_007512 [Dendrobium nobile]|uniref:Uncharacterized protein n=1 Tax=Dendrobium nobile TaxID=94219 RepID=A0A8T3BWR3_DENNO|nr:hypothetical protein KFK09_007512 [Dendrobium nobile]
MARCTCNHPEARKNYSLEAAKHKPNSGVINPQPNQAPAEHESRPPKLPAKQANRVVSRNQPYHSSKNRNTQKPTDKQHHPKRPKSNSRKKKVTKSTSFYFSSTTFATPQDKSFFNDATNFCRYSLALLLLTNRLLIHCL